MIKQQKKTGEQNFIRFLIVSDKGIDSSIKVDFIGKRKPPVYEIPFINFTDPKDFAVMIEK